MKNHCRMLWLLIPLMSLTNFVSAEEKQSLIGSKAKDWVVSDWINSKPLQISDFHGKVLLVRWWTTGCPFCSATAPALNEFYKQYHARGLEVIGFYHHKSSEPLNVDRVRKGAAELGFHFPIAIDHEWKTLNAWWLRSADKGWTSVSFLIDRQGKIRYIHEGGEYVRGDQAFNEIEQKIEQLLAER